VVARCIRYAGLRGLCVVGLTLEPILKSRLSAVLKITILLMIIAVCLLCSLHLLGIIEQNELSFAVVKTIGVSGLLGSTALAVAALTSPRETS